MGKASGKAILMVIGTSDFRDEELLIPKAILEKAGVQVIITSTTLSAITGMLDAQIKPDVLLAEVKAADYDAIIFVGGLGARQYFNDQKAFQLARDIYQKNGLICAISIAPNILANAGLLQGKNVTCWSGKANIENVVDKGAVHTGNSVERDGYVITASSHKVVDQFGMTILESLNERSESNISEIN